MTQSPFARAKRLARDAWRCREQIHRGFPTCLARGTLNCPLLPRLHGHRSGMNPVLKHANALGLGNFASGVRLSAGMNARHQVLHRSEGT